MDRFRDRHQGGALLDYDENLQDYELRKLKTKKYKDNPSTPHDQYVEYDIRPDDTLHGICLRYACSINQVKRLNGLVSDQDFHGLRKIKLPVGKLGLLDDVLRSQSSDDAQEPFQITQENQPVRRDINSPGSALREFLTIDDANLLSNTTDVRFLTNSTTCDEPNDARFEVGQVFQDLDYHIEKVKAATGSYDQRAVDLTSEFETLHNPSQTTTSVASRLPELFFCDETFGLNFRKLIIIIFVICVLTPLIYIQTITQAPNRAT